MQGGQPTEGEGHSPGMVPMDLVAVIRHKVHAEGVPIREVARELGLSRNTIRRYARAKASADRPAVVAGARDAGARRESRRRAESIWKSRRSFTAGKQRLTATRLWELLREAGHTASERTVRRLVAEFRSAEREVTVPLVYAPGRSPRSTSSRSGWSSPACARSRGCS